MSNSVPARDAATLDPRLHFMESGALSSYADGAILQMEDERVSTLQFCIHECTRSWGRCGTILRRLHPSRGPSTARAGSG